MTTHVVKVGGARLDDLSFRDRLMDHVRQLAASGHVVLVHGGGAQISELQSQLGLPEKKHEGLRATTRDDMAVVAMILAGRLNKELVAHFVHGGLDALGVAGCDRGLLRAPIRGLGELGRVGDAPAVDTEALEQLTSCCQVLVLSPVSLGPDGGLLNVNADTVAQALAVAVGADILEFVTDVDAVRGADGPEHHLDPDRVHRLIDEEHVRGGMRPKLLAAVAALDEGVDTVRVGSLRSLTQGECTEVRA